MEHKWGRWVTEFSLGSFGASIASRKLPLTLRQLVSNRPAPPGFHWRTTLPTDTSLPMNSGLFANAAGHSHFPYGEPVEADGPV